MIVDLGHGALFLAAGFSLVQFIASFWGFITIQNSITNSFIQHGLPRRFAPRNDRKYEQDLVFARKSEGLTWRSTGNESFLEFTIPSKRWALLGKRSAAIQFAFMSLAFAILIYSFVACDFSLATVFTNCHSAMPTLYRVAGSWGNHEGSLLLWVWILSGVGFIMSKQVKGELTTASLGIQGLLTFIFIIFMWYASDPFKEMATIVSEGLGLNPLLQDRGLAIHPPFLYLGYVGYSSVFSITLGALLTRNINKNWLDAIAPWSKASWAFLTIGIALGSWWAYYELGWGGWWFWDPVENASLMPWLAGTALLHTTIIGQKTNSLWRWNVLLASTTFGLSLCGTFLVRSGLISSIHAFAVAPESGLIILSIISLTMVVSMFLFATYPFTTPTHNEILSREGLISIGCYMICLVLLIIVWGTFYPLVLEAFSGNLISVGAPYFNKATIPIVFAILIIMPIAMFSSWKNSGLRGAIDQAVLTITPAFAVGALLLYTIKPAPFFNIMGLSLSLWLILSSIKYVYKTRIQGLPVFFGHIGLSLVIIGIICATTWGEEKSQIIPPGKSMQLSGYELRLNSVKMGEAQNYKFEQAHIEVFKGREKITDLYPERRLYLPQESILSETAIYTNGFGNIYTSLGHFYGETGWEVRAMNHPMAPWIWWGGAIMALGALFSIVRRRAPPQ